MNQRVPVYSLRIATQHNRASYSRIMEQYAVQITSLLVIEHVMVARVVKAPYTPYTIHIVGRASGAEHRNIEETHNYAKRNANNPQLYTGSWYISVIVERPPVGHLIIVCTQLTDSKCNRNARLPNLKPAQPANLQTCKSATGKQTCPPSTIYQAPLNYYRK